MRIYLFIGKGFPSRQISVQGNSITSELGASSNYGMSKMRPPIQLVTFLALLFISPVASGQVSNGRIFTAVPVVQRQRFIERLNLYIDLLIKNNEPKLIELYDEETLCSLCRGKCSEDCAPPMVVEVPKGFRSVLLEFKPFKVSPYCSQGNWGYSIEVDQRERLSLYGKKNTYREAQGKDVYRIPER